MYIPTDKLTTYCRNTVLMIIFKAEHDLAPNQSELSLAIKPEHAR